MIIKTPVAIPMSGMMLSFFYSVGFISACIFFKEYAAAGITAVNALMLVGMREGFNGLVRSGEIHQYITKSQEEGS